MVGIYNIDSTH